MTKKTENRGKTKGSGPKKGAKYKKGAASVDRKQSILDAVEKVAKEKDMSCDEAMVRMIYDENIQDSVRASIWKGLNEATVVKETDQNISVNRNFGPAIGLPPMEEDPALKVLDGGKK